MSVIDSILSPAFLTSRIPMISLLLGAVILVIFSDVVLRNLIFPIADFVKETTHTKILDYKRSDGFRLFAKLFSESLATIIFLVYCFVGTSILAEYFFEPLLGRMKNFILIAVIALFLMISYAINKHSVRRMFFDCMK